MTKTEEQMPPYKVVRTVTSNGTSEQKVQADFEAYWENRIYAWIGNNADCKSTACRAWQACQRVNDAEIARLREALLKCKEHAQLTMTGGTSRLNAICRVVDEALSAQGGENESN